MVVSWTGSYWTKKQFNICQYNTPNANGAVCGVPVGALWVQVQFIVQITETSFDRFWFNCEFNYLSMQTQMS